MRAAAVCGVLGPVAFVSAWAAGGLVAEDYSPLRDAISELAAEGAPTRPLMSVGLVLFGVAVPVWAVTLRRVLGTGPAAAATVAALATLGVALLPLTREGDQPQDVAHAVVAATGYVGMVLTPLLAVPSLRRQGYERAAAASLVIGLVSALALVGSVLVAGRGGGLQRLGLTVVDAWHVVAAGWVLRRR